ncbi:type IV pilus assembly protein PilM [Demequina lutea]|uniref:Type IV pilus assembly protein PilM n=1 Tax=Demequina lutea TaxID=431489 RepID=A0A7Y9ZA12_9MICO|nr:type IV pilus assembly protein PilM [Demequina lutea]NYI41361.1 type IV pilus assembly protein PilM [Demequina lutea]
MAKSRVIGLDIGTTMVRAAEVEQEARSGRATLVSYGEVSLAPGAVEDASVVSTEVVSAAIQRLWHESKFSSRNVVMGMGAITTAVREIDVPFMPMAQLRQSLPFQVQEMLPMPVDEAILDFYPGSRFDGPAGEMVRGLLVAATKRSVSANVAAAERGKLHPQVVDLNALALLRSAKVSSRQENVVAVVDIGGSMTTVAIAARGVPRMVRVIPNGGRDVTNAVSRQMNIPIADAEGLKRQIASSAQVPQEWALAHEAINEVNRNLVDSIRNTFVYHQSNNPGAAIDMVVLTGGGAQLGGLPQLLSNAARIAVTFGDPLAGMSIESKAQVHISAPVTMAVAVGLALAVAS